MIAGVRVCDSMGTPWLGQQTDAFGRVDGACKAATALTGVFSTKSGRGTFVKSKLTVLVD